MPDREVDQVFTDPSRVLVEVPAPGVGLQPQSLRQLALGEKAERPWPAHTPVLPTPHLALDRDEDGEVEREAARARARLEVHESDQRRSTAGPWGGRPREERLFPVGALLPPVRQARCRSDGRER